MTAFRKMHGLGNDFAVFDARREPLAFTPALAAAVADRKRGIGCDQLIVIEKDGGRADAFMQIYNNDGGEVESCGNAARCLAKLLLDETGKDEVSLDSLGGLMRCRRAEGDAVTVDMGIPQLDWREIPMSQAVETESFALPLPGNDDAALRTAAAVSVGNPHLVLFVDNAAEAPVTTLGATLEHHAWFPNRTNVEFVERRSDRALRMRVWERGAGVTQACGTGACASAVAAIRRGLVGRKVRVELDGGTLDIEWRESDGHVLMTGPTALSFTGEIDLATFGGKP
jgi:diaminopimelate epimerase